MFSNEKDQILENVDEQECFFVSIYIVTSDSYRNISDWNLRFVNVFALMILYLHIQLFIFKIFTTLKKIIHRNYLN